METKRECERCGASALVRIRTQVAGTIVIRQLCLQCADEEDRAGITNGRNLNVPAVVMIGGLFLLLISIFADMLGLGDARGFGWEQWTGITISGVLAFAGALMRVPTVLAIGLLMGAITLLADWLGMGDAEGFGHTQILGLVCGVLLLVVGLGLARAVRAGAY